MANSDTKVRCVNIDWLEVYCFESIDRFPVDADYFRAQGYFVHERDYGTRHYNQMFTIEDEFGQPWIEIRRDPPSGQSRFSGLQFNSCHIRLTNRACYDIDPIGHLREFLVKHDYLFQRIFRIDICYDFERFDDNTKPEAFARRYIEKKYRKVNQCKLRAIGNDDWSDFDWESLSWGNPKSMVSTKLYNKTKELKAGGNEKPYIPYSWACCGLISNPLDGCKVNEDGTRTYPDIWRVEFSIKSSARTWVKIEDASRRKKKQEGMPHTLERFDTKDKLWMRFEELAYHYFRFKLREFKKNPDGTKSDELLRKDLCKDRKVFDFRLDRNFYQVQQLPKASKPNHEDEILRRRLTLYQLVHVSPEIKKACQILLDNIGRDEVRRITLSNEAEDIKLMQHTLAVMLEKPDQKLEEVKTYLKSLIDGNSLF